jgi:predicted ribosome quality control (RQC) complex YloA/Tae2 family protein
MPKSKNRANHKSKVEQRNQRLRAHANSLKKKFQAELAAEIAEEEKKQKGELLPEEMQVMDEGAIRAATPEEIEQMSKPE